MVRECRLSQKMLPRTQNPTRMTRIQKTPRAREDRPRHTRPSMNDMRSRELRGEALMACVEHRRTELDAARGIVVHESPSPGARLHWTGAAADTPSIPQDYHKITRH